MLHFYMVYHLKQEDKQKYTTPIFNKKCKKLTPLKDIPSLSAGFAPDRIVL